MDKNSLNTNKQFMIGNGMLAFGVFAVIIIFLYMSFRFQRKADKVQTYEGVYNIELTNSFAGDSIAVVIFQVFKWMFLIFHDLQFSCHIPRPTVDIYIFHIFQFSSPYFTS